MPSQKHRWRSGKDNPIGKGPTHLFVRKPWLKDQIRDTLRNRVAQGLAVGRPRKGEDPSSDDGLNTEGREVLMLRGLKMPIAEIARRIKWSRNSVKKFLRRWGKR